MKETLEEFIDKVDTPADFDQFTFDEGIRVGAKWQQEQDKNKYSEEEVDKLISDFKHDLRESTSNYVKQNCEGAIFGLERLKQFKKK